MGKPQFILIELLDLSKEDSDNKAKVERLVQTIRSKGIKLLALDFDLTFIDIHTHGSWEDSLTLDVLAQHVRPCMRDLLQHAQHKGVYTCIVTFHPRSFLIRDLLRKIYSKKVADNTYLQAGPCRRDFSPRGEFTGKEWHLQNVVADVLKDHKVAVDKRDTLLLDDDMCNVNVACSQGYRAMQLQVKDRVVDYSTLDSFERMLRIAG